MDHITLSPDTHELNRVQLTLRVAALTRWARAVYLNYIAYRNTNAFAAPTPGISSIQKIEPIQEQDAILFTIRHGGGDGGERLGHQHLDATVPEDKPFPLFPEAQ